MPNATPGVMSKSPAMPFKPRPIDPKAWDALDRAVAAAAAMREAEAVRAAESVKRAEAIAEARRLGLNLETIGERLGVGKARVRQYLASRQTDK
jgi:hypothetical protein